DGASANFTAADGPHDGAYQAVILSRFDPVGVSADGIALPVDGHRLEVEDQVIVARNANDQFRLRAAWDRQTPVVAAHILIDGGAIDAVVLALYVDGFIRADGNHC